MKLNKIKSTFFYRIKIVFTIVFITINAINVCAYGLSDWEHNTPGGNVMRDNGSGNEVDILGIENGVFKVQKWYFYKNHIVGTSGKKYFIVNENVKTVYFFDKELDWNNAINQNNLKPKITRWYMDNWVLMDALLVLFFFGFILFIPLFFLFLWMLYKAIIVEGFNLSKPFTTLSFAIMFIFGIILIFDAYPQSF